LPANSSPKPLSLGMAGEWHTWQLIWYLRANAGMAKVLDACNIINKPAMVILRTNVFSILMVIILIYSLSLLQTPDPFPVSPKGEKLKDTFPLGKDGLGFIAEL